MKQRLQRLSQGITALLMIIVLSACDRSNAPSGLVYCSEGNPGSFNPQTTTSNITTDATYHQIYNGLVEYNNEKGEIQGALAKDWQVSQDGLVYIFTLKDNIHFHQTTFFSPTRPLNADDVLFSFNRIIDENHPFHPASITGYPFFESLAFSKRIKKISKLADNKVAFYLHQRDAAFLSTLSSAHSVILSKEYGLQLMASNKPLRTIDWQPIGTGAFSFVEYLPNEYIRYKRNTDYWKTPPDFDQLIFNIFKNNIQRLSHFITGDCAISALPNISDINYITRNKNVNIDIDEGHNLAYWAFNTTKAPFNDIRVRQALSYAINRNNLLHSVYRETAVKADSILPPSSWAYAERPNAIHYNPIKARQLLQQAGITHLEIDIWVQYSARSFNTDSEKMAELMQSDLRYIGIKSTIIPFTWGDFEHKKINNYDTMLTGWIAANTDPNDFLSPLFSCEAIQSSNNLSRWCSQKLNTLLAQARSTIVPEKRKKLYQHAENIIGSMFPILPIAHANKVTLLNKSLSSSQINPYNGIAFENFHINAFKDKH